VLLCFDEVDLFLLFYEDVFVSLVEWSGVGDMYLLAELLLGGLWSQLFTEGRDLLL